MPSGKKPTPRQIKRYEELRAMNWSPAEAAKAVHLSRSWAYKYEEGKTSEARELHFRRGPHPSRDLREAVEVIVADRTGDQARAFEVFERFGIEMVPAMAAVAWCLAGYIAENENRAMAAVLEGTPMADELAASPVTPEEIVEAIPPGLRSEGRWFRIQPPRVAEWYRRAAEMFPELQEIEAQVADIEASDDPGTGFAEFESTLSRETHARSL